MSNVGYATLTIIPSAKGFQSALGKETGGAMKRSGAAGGAAFGGAMIGGLKPMVGALAGIFAAQKITGFFSSAISEASGLGESVNALNVVYGEHSAGIQALGKGAAQTLGLSNLEFNNLAVRFSSFSKTIAGEGGNVVGTLEDLTGRASDFASVMNLEVSDAAQLFQSGLAGESEPLRAFGIDLSAASVEAYAYANGIASAGEELTESQKVQARYGALMEQTAQTAGDFANTQDSLANVQRRLSSSWADMKAKLGEAFLPVLEKAFGFVNSSVLPGIERMVQGFSGLFAIFANNDFNGALAAAFGWEEDSAIVDRLFNIREAVLGVFSAAPADGGGLSAMFDGLSAAAASLLPTLQSIGANVMAALAPLMPILQQVADVVMTQIVPAFLTFATNFITGVQPVLQTVGNIITTSIIPAVVNMAAMVVPAFQKVGETIAVMGQTVGPILQGIATIISTVWGFIGPFVISIVQSIVSNVVGAFTGILDVIQGTVRLVAAIFQGDWGAAWEALKQIVSGAVQAVWNLVQLWFLGRMIGVVRSAISGLKGLFTGGWNAIVSTVTGAATNIVARVTGGMSSARGAVSGALNSIRSFFSSAWSNIVSGVTTAFVRIVSTVRGKVSEVVSFVAGLPGKITGALGNLGSLLSAQGRAIIDGFLGGLKASWGKVTDFVGGIASWIADNKGPLPYDRRLLIPAGKAIMDGLGKGLESQLGSLKGTLNTITDSIVDEVTRGVSDGSRAIAAASEGLVPTAPSFGSPDINVNRATREQPSGSPLIGSLTLQSSGNVREDLDEVNFHVRRIARGGAHA